MANFTVTWNANQNANTSNTKAGYRKKSVGGAYTYGGNHSPSSSVSETFTTLDDNEVYEFIITNYCSVGGPTNSVVYEGIKFACPASKSISSTTDTSTQLSVSGLPSSIMDVLYEVRLTSNNNLVTNGSFTSSAGTASGTITGLSASTNYTIKIELRALVNGSNSDSSLGSCSLTFTTAAPPTCPTPSIISVV